MDHDKVVVDMFTDSLNREFVQEATLSSQFDQVRVPFARAVRIVDGGCGDRLSLAVFGLGDVLS